MLRPGNKTVTRSRKVIAPTTLWVLFKKVPCNDKKKVQEREVVALLYFDIARSVILVSVLRKAATARRT